MLAAGDRPEILLQGYPWLEKENVQGCLVRARRLIGQERIEASEDRGGRRNVGDGWTWRPPAGQGYHNERVSPLQGRHTTTFLVGSKGAIPVIPPPSVAGLCDVSGRVLGLMPHLERHVLPTQHPRRARPGLEGEGDASGSRLFRNAVGYFG